MNLPARPFFASVLLLAVASGLGAQYLGAQCTVVPGTGCPGAAAPACSGSSAIGQTLTIRCPAPSGGLAAMVIGFPANAPIGVTGLLPVPTCSGLSCTVAVDPNRAVLASEALQIRIPNDPRLVGLVVRAQCVDILLRLPLFPCVQVSAAIDLQIT